MYFNLKAEMARHNISVADIAGIIHKTEQSVRRKIVGKYDFTMTECSLIRDAYFPGYSIEYLFSKKILSQGEKRHEEDQNDHA